jgi:hypothetical protein
MKPAVFVTGSPADWSLLSVVLDEYTSFGPGSSGDLRESR